MKKILLPLAGQTGRAAVYAGAALALMLVYLQFGQRSFFTAQLAGALLPLPAAGQVQLWAALYQFAAAFACFFLLPVLLLGLTQQSVREAGLGLGDWRAGLVVAGLGVLLVALPGGISAGGMADFRAEYPMGREAAASMPTFIYYQLAYGLLYYVAWESFFRGFLQLGLSKYLGTAGALLFQTSASTLLHIGKPFAEIWAALAAGFVFGLLAVRLRSIWPLVIVHWALGLLTDLFCARAAGWF